MFLSRLRLPAVCLCLTGCAVRTAPEPAEFKLSPEVVRSRYAASRTVGVIQLFAQEIVTTKDEKGRDAHLASGGALLLKKSMPPIQAQASSILLTAEFAEIRGKSTVKKGDRLYLGKADSSRIKIDGVVIKPTGPHEVRGIAPVAAAELKTTSRPETDDAPGVPPEAPRKKASAPKARPKANAGASVSKPADDASPAAVSPEERARVLNLLRPPKTD